MALDFSFSPIENKTDAELIVDRILDPDDYFADEMVDLMRPGDTYWQVRELLKAKADESTFRHFCMNFDPYFVCRYQQAQGAGMAELPPAFELMLREWLGQGKPFMAFFRDHKELGGARDWNLSKIMSEFVIE